ncbi:MAG TPA: glycosyltransferase [Terriglobales bacterium]|nr:glycosyltransferase [Terriglobales bacterium]
MTELLPHAAIAPRHQEADRPRDGWAVINAANAYAGGGATLAQNFLRWLAPRAIDTMAIVPDQPGFRSLTWSHHLQPVYVAPFSMKGLRRLGYDEIWLPRFCRRLRARVLFTLGSIGPAHTECPHSVLLQNSYYAYGDCEARRRLPFSLRLRLPWEERLFARCARNCTTLIAQTPVVAERLQARFALPAAKIEVVGNAVDAQRLVPLPKVPSRAYRLLMLSRYYSHKNFELLPLIAQSLMRRGALNIRFITTVAKADGAAGSRWLRSLDRHGVAHMFDNRGFVEYEQLPCLYANADAAILPSLLESSTATYSEAVHFGLPMITSDLDFARGSCQRAALYCDPLDPEAFADAIVRLMESPALAAELVAEGRVMLKHGDLTWDRAAPRLAAAAGIKVLDAPTA